VRQRLRPAHGKRFGKEPSGECFLFCPVYEVREVNHSYTKSSCRAIVKLCADSRDVISGPACWGFAVFCPIGHESGPLGIQIPSPVSTLNRTANRMS
jgi:hypothetical protein